MSCRHGDEVRVRIRQVIVTTSLDDGLSRPIADNVRAAIERFGITGDKPVPGAAAEEPHMTTLLQPPGWPRPKGYANGVKVRGQMVFVAGMIGWDAEGQLPVRRPRAARCARRSRTCAPCSTRPARSPSTSCA